MNVLFVVIKVDYLIGFDLNLLFGVYNGLMIDLNVFVVILMVFLLVSVVFSDGLMFLVVIVINGVKG